MSALNNILFIDDDPPMVTDRWKHIPVNNKKCMFNLAEEISKKPTDLIVINAHFRFLPQENDFKKYEYLQDCAGIDLLKFLRLLKVNTHCVLLSPLSVKQLLQLKPGNFIITSQGVTVFPYYGNFEEIKAKKFVIKKAPKRLPDIFIRSDFSLPEDERHNWANWWGIDRLWNIHRVVEQRKYGLKEPEELNEYPVELKKKLKKLKNQQALCLYGLNEKNIENRLYELHDENIKLTEDLETLQNARRDFEESIDNLSEKIKNKDYSLSDADEFIYQIKKILQNFDGNTRKYWISETEKIKEKLDERHREFILRYILSLEKKRSRDISYLIRKKEKKLDTLDEKFSIEEKNYITKFKKIIAHLEHIIQSLKSQVEGLDLNILREKLQKRNPRVLHIDDQAHEGWAQIFQQIIYGENSNNFEVIQPDKNTEIDEKYYENEILNKIISHEPDIILLDLRLSGEYGLQTNTQELTGTYVLNYIRQDYPGIPIIATTASNKSWSFEKLQQFGIDGYWVKEGIDTPLDERSSVKNYIRFVELVERATSSEFKFLNEYSKKIVRIENNPDRFWWEKSNKDGEIAENERELVVSILCDGMRLIKDYLANIKLKKVEFTTQNQWFYPSLIILHLSKILKLINNNTGVEGITGQKWSARFLSEVRKDAFHLSPRDSSRSIELTINTTIKWVNKLLDYLMESKESVK